MTTPAHVATPAAAVAERFGLQPIGQRTPLPRYLGSLWQRRHFIYALARARIDLVNSESKLGQMWEILNPLLNAAVYYLIFGLLLKTSRGIPNYIAFLVTGVFIFGYTTQSIQTGARSVAANLGLVRTLRFPRAVLPVAATLEQLLKLGPALVVLAVIVLATGEPLTLHWLLLPVALLLQTLFNAGGALILARMTAEIRDISQLLPFLIRTWGYLSGMFYSIATFTQGKPDWIRVVLTVNPGAVYIEVARDSLLATYQSPPGIWALAVLWGVGTFVFGVVYFWRAEEKYGRG